MQLLVRIFILFQIVVVSASAFSCFGQNPEVKEAPKSPNSKKNNKKKSDLESKIAYKAVDSIRFEVKDHKVYLYGNAEVTYQDINLKAAYIELDFSKNIVHATYVLDSAKREKGIPVFTQGAETFKAKDLIYNFETKRGLIKKIYTKEGDGFMQGNTVKKEPDNSILIKNGGYTTCNLDHPHFEIKFGKAKVIPNDKIITGPAYLSIEDVPTPLMVPFGFFPNVKGQKNGLLIPGYGSSASKGYNLSNGGYYWGFKDKADLQLRGDIYSRGSWGLRALSNYKNRYHYSGNFAFSFANNRMGEKGAADFLNTKDFKIRWTHTQDPKARPNSRFSASVNAGTSAYNKYNSYNPTDYLSNQMQSSISYSTSFWKVFNFQANANHTQNTATKTINITLPSLLLNANKSFKLFPNSAKSPRISISYASESRAVLNTRDSLIFKPGVLDNVQKGMRHTVSMNTSFKILRFLSFVPAININELWYLDRTEKSFVNNTIVTNTANGFTAGHDATFSASLTTKVYGMFLFKNLPVKAIRHVITPAIRFTYRPDYFAKQYNYSRTVASDTMGHFSTYSIFENLMFGSPAIALSEAVNFSLSNNLEMKVRSRKDTINGFKRVVLIDNLTIDFTKDLAKDSLQWSPVSIRANTKLFKNLDIRFNSLWDPYITDKTGVRNLNTSEYDANHRLLRLKSTDWNWSLNWHLSSKKQKKAATNISNVRGPEGEIKDIQQNPNSYVDFNIPWNLNLAFSFIRSDLYNYYTGNTHNLVQTINFNGDINITKKWKIGFSSGYDLINKGVSYTSIDIYRDLHCWEMKFHYIPIGFRKSYNLTINVKSSVLQDLKLQKKRDWGDL